MMSLLVILHNIRSVHNVGAIFRTAEAAGVSQIILTGYTPLPIDRFGRARTDLAKAALGAQDMVPWKHYKTLPGALTSLKKDGYTVVGVEQDPRAVLYSDYIPGEKTVLVLGNEVRGLSKAMRLHCDMLVEIPMQGRKESLNVSVAAGIVLFRLREKA